MSIFWRRYGYGSRILKRAEQVSLERKIWRLGGGIDTTGANTGAMCIYRHSLSSALRLLGETIGVDRFDLSTLHFFSFDS